MLVAPNATAQTAAFKNTYKPEPIEIDFIYNVNKILEGRDIKAGEFEFELYDLNGTSEELLQTKKNDAPKQDGKAGIYLPGGGREAVEPGNPQPVRSAGGAESGRYTDPDR